MLEMTGGTHAVSFLFLDLSVVAFHRRKVIRHACKVFLLPATFLASMQHLNAQSLWAFLVPWCTFCMWHQVC